MSYLFFDAKAEGAAGNGVTDDTWILNDWLSKIGASEGGALLLKPGNYLISAPLMVPSRCTLAGVGKGITKLTLAPGSNCSMLLNSDRVNGNDSVEISGLALNGNRAQNDGTLYGIDFFGLQNVVLRDLEFYNCESGGLFLNGGGEAIGQFKSLMTVSGIYSHDNGGFGIQLSNGLRRSTISDILVELNGTAGLVIDASEMTISNVRAFRNTGRGVYFRNIFGDVANGITAEGNGEHGILVQGATRMAGAGWTALANSVAFPNAYDDINFGPNPDPMGYGANTDIAIAGIVAGTDPWLADRYFNDVVTERYSVYVGDESNTNIRLTGRLSEAATGTYRAPATIGAGYEADFT